MKKTIKNRGKVLVFITLVLLVGVIYLILPQFHTDAESSVFSIEQINETKIKIIANKNIELNDADKIIAINKLLTDINYVIPEYDDDYLIKMYDNIFASDYMLLNVTNYEITKDETTNEENASKITTDQMSLKFMQRVNPWYSSNKYIRITTQVYRKSDYDTTGNKAIVVATTVDWLKYFSTWDRQDALCIAYADNAYFDDSTYGASGYCKTNWTPNGSLTGSHMDPQDIINYATVSANLNKTIFKARVQSYFRGVWNSTMFYGENMLRLTNSTNIQSIFFHDQGLIPQNNFTEKISITINAGVIKLKFPVTSVKQYASDAIFVNYYEI